MSYYRPRVRSSAFIWQRQNKGNHQTTVNLFIHKQKNRGYLFCLAPFGDYLKYLYANNFTNFH
jgi:hypothetical protein